MQAPFADDDAALGPAQQLVAAEQDHVRSAADAVLGARFVGDGVAREIPQGAGSDIVDDQAMLCASQRDELLRGAWIR